MKHKFFKRLLLAVVVLFGFSGFAQAIEVEFTFTEQPGYQVRLVTAIITVGFNGEVITESHEDVIHPNEIIDVQSVYDYKDNYEGEAEYIEIDGNTVTIAEIEEDEDGNIMFRKSMSISYSYNLVLYDSYNFEDIKDISHLIENGATINVGDLFEQLKVKRYSLTVEIVNSDGKTDAGDDLRVYAKSADGFYDYYIPENGKVAIGLKEGTYTIRVNDYDSKTIEVKEDMTITLTVPKQISFKVTVDGKPISGNYKDDGFEARVFTIGYEREMSLKSSENKARIDPEQSYRVALEIFNDNYIFVQGTTKITDGGTIRIATFNVESDGNGLVFPRDEFSGSGSYKLFVGNPIRLAAIPVGKAEFVSWTVNGKEYTEPLIDFTVKDDINTATAKFSGEIVNHIKAADSNIGQINVRIEGDYLILPSDTEGAACIYATDGRLVKRTGVIGDHLSIGDLPSGAYVLALTANGQRWNAQFVKP